MKEALHVKRNQSEIETLDLLTLGNAKRMHPLPSLQNFVLKSVDIDALQYIFISHVKGFYFASYSEAYI